MRYIQIMKKNLVKDFIKSYLNNVDTNEILKEAELLEKNSNQLLNLYKYN